MICVKEIKNCQNYSIKLSIPKMEEVIICVSDVS